MNMQDYAQYLAHEAQSDIAALHQFRILYDPAAMSCHLFFEGEEDSLYYMPEVRRQFNATTTHVYQCGGKKNVIEVRENIKSNGYDINKCLFFVDRDFDDYLKCQVKIDDHTYLTDHYSIENDICNINNAKILLEDIVRLSKADPDFVTIIGDLSTSYDHFYRIIRPLIAWIVAAKEENCGPNLRNTNGLNKILQLDSNAKSTINTLGFNYFKKQALGSKGTPSLKAILKWRRQLEIPLCKFWVRGKYDIWFFQQGLLRLIEEANLRRKAAGARVIRVPTSLREARIFELLGGRVAIPTSLSNFLAHKNQQNESDDKI